jgi:pantetheine-phosphate adenylyltransferase
MKKFKSLICGGTFDHFHKGHKAFIKKALGSADSVLIGVTSDRYVQVFKSKIEIENFNIRKKAVKDYLNFINAKAQIISINSAYDPDLEYSKKYDSILATSTTKKIVDEINSKRIQNGIPELCIITSSMVLAEDGLEISSTRVRDGEIDRNGKLYLSPDWKNKTLILPDSLRHELQIPWGDILSDIPNNINGFKTIVIGDETAKRFNEQNINQFLSIVDFLINRQVRFKSLTELGFGRESAQKVKNAHGTMTSELLRAIRDSFQDKKRKVLLVEGEDDLSALAVLLLAPLGFSIFYGQPNQGLIQVQVNEENKEKAFQLVSRFDKR